MIGTQVKAQLEGLNNTMPGLLEGKGRKKIRVILEKAFFEVLSDLARAENDGEQ